MKKRFYFLAFFSLLMHFCIGQTFDPILAARLQKKLDSMKTAQNIKGISASIFYPGKGFWQGVTGISSVGFPITKDMEFGIASNTKLFTAVTLLKLAEKGIVNLTDSLYKWLPTRANIDSTITIRQLLNHTSGLTDISQVVGYNDSINKNLNRIFAPEELMAWVGAPVSAPGKSYNYTNINYILVGMIIEKATGKKFGQILRDSILSPLKLDSTFLDVEESVIGTIAHPSQDGIDISKTPRISLNSIIWSAGGMYSTSGEMAQWYYALMNGKVLHKNSFKEMTTFASLGNYGLGIGLNYLGGRIVWQHGGYVSGYRSHCAYDPASGAIIIVLTNNNPAAPDLVAQELLLTLVNYRLPLSVSTLSENQIIVYPNPTNDEVNLNIGGDELKSIKIYDSTGQLILESTKVNFSISNLPEGIYFAVIQTDKNVITKKIIKY